MKLSENTVKIIKNFSLINDSMIIRQGSTLSTMSIAKNIMAKAEITETFPVEFGIYDLNEFLGAVSLFEDPNFEFGKNSLTISDNKSSIEYVYAEKSGIVSPTKQINIPEIKTSFDLSSKDMQTIIKSANILSVNDVTFIGSPGSLVVNVHDVKNDSGNSFRLDITPQDGSESDIEEFSDTIKVENMKMILGNYHVELGNKPISHFTNIDGLNIEYWIAVETAN